MNPYGFNIKKLWKNILMATFHKFIHFFVHIKKSLSSSKRNIPLSYLFFARSDFSGNRWMKFFVKNAQTAQFENFNDFRLLVNCNSLNSSERERGDHNSPFIAIFLFFSFICRLAVCIVSTGTYYAYAFKCKLCENMSEKKLFCCSQFFEFFFVWRQCSSLRHDNEWRLDLRKIQLYDKQLWMDEFLLIKPECCVVQLNFIY